MELQSEKGGVEGGGNLKIFYSPLKHALAVPPTHIHVYGVFMVKTLSIT
jgi:hypothetical protein